MNLEHFSTKPLTIEMLEDKTQDNEGRLFKPVGLWISVAGEYDWESWCRDEKYCDIDKAIRHKVDLDMTHILLLKSARDIVDFTWQYRSTTIAPNNYINWELVAAHHHGIIITPYIHECRLAMGTEWYYPWDCAGGCIWNIKAIKNITIITKEKNHVRVTTA